MISALKQLVLSIAIIFGAGWLWYSYFPGAKDFVAKHEMLRAVIPGADAAQGSGGQSAGAPGGKSAGGPGGGPGGGSGRRGFGPRTTLVVTRPATAEVLDSRVSALGTGQALHSVTVLPAESGTLTEVSVEAGQTVKAGDVIARLDPTSQQIALDKAKVANDDAQRTLERNKQLLSTNSVSATAEQQAQVAADTAALNLRSAEEDLKNRTVPAPIGGTVGIVQVDAGNEVTAQTVITTIEDDSAILVNFWLPERLVGMVKSGDAVSAVPVSRPGQVVKAKIVALDNKVDSASGTFEAQARLPNDGGDLRPGMSFTVEISLPGERYVAVDPLAIQWGSDGSYVWRVEGDKVARVPVRVVQRNTETVLVAGKLAEGDPVVTEGLDGLRDGTQVEVAGAAKPVEEADASAGGAGGGQPAKPAAAGN